jgi:cytidylate kinase
VNAELANAKLADPELVIAVQGREEADIVTLADGKSMPAPRFDAVVAIDGPSGSGKSTAARRLAERLGARYLDTGAMYRAVTLAVLRSGADPEDASAVEKVLTGVRIDITVDPLCSSVCLSGVAVDQEIRSPEVNAAVSAVSAVPAVRTALIAQQRRIVERGGLVVEGRDITTVVAPDASVRVLLTASPDARAARRGAETETSLAEQAESLRARDIRDSRTTSFLRPADGVEVLDTTTLSADEVLEALIELVDQRVGPGTESSPEEFRP